MKLLEILETALPPTSLPIFFFNRSGKNSEAVLTIDSLSNFSDEVEQVNDTITVTVHLFLSDEVKENSHEMLYNYLLSANENFERLVGKEIEGYHFINVVPTLIQQPVINQNTIVASSTTTFTYKKNNKRGR